MRILHAVEFYAPSVGGAQEVVRRVSEGLSARGHDVTVATTRLDERTEGVLNGVRVVGFDVSGNAVRGMQGEVEEYRRFVTSGDFDVVLLYAAQQWTTDAVLDLAGTSPAAWVLAPCGFSGLRQPAYADYFASLPDALRRFDRIVVHSSATRDAGFLEQEGIEAVTVIANGASEDEFSQPPRGFRQALRIPEDEPLVVSVGSHTGLKGHAEAIRAVRRTRASRLTLAVLGNELPGGCARSCARQAGIAGLRSRGRKHYVVAEVERPLVVSALAEADVVLLASRVECAPLVLVEAMAAGTPFVATRVGNAEELAESSGAGITIPVGPARDGYARVPVGRVTEALDALLGDADLRQRMGVAGREAWLRGHTWSQLCEQYEATYVEAVEARARR